MVHGDVDRARVVGQMTRDAGLDVACYGSYYRVGCEAEPSFDDVLASAIALGAPLIRVWAGNRSSTDLTNTDVDTIAEDLRRICDRAGEVGISVATEFHGGTLTDAEEPTRSLLQRVNRTNLQTLWQPLAPANSERRLAEIESLLPWIANIHVFQWDLPSVYPLSDGELEWARYLAAIAKAGRPVGTLLEFVKDASVDQFRADAASLLRIIG